MSSTSKEMDPKTFSELITHSLITKIESQIDEEQFYLQSKISSHLQQNTNPLLGVASKESIQSSLITLVETVQSGYYLLCHEAKKNEPSKLSESIHFITQALQQLQSPVSYTKVLLDFHSGKSLQKILQIPEQVIQTLYQTGREFFETSDFDRASRIFGFIIWIDNMNYDLWIAFGHSLYHGDHYNRAISAYVIASQMNVQDPWPLIYASQASDAIQDAEKSTIFLTEALQILAQNPTKENQPLLDTIRREISKKPEMSQRAFS